MSCTRLRYSDDHWARDRNPVQALDKYLRQYDTPYGRVKTRVFDRFLGKDLSGQTVLDYGGGVGYISVRCASLGAEVVLVDIEPAALQAAKLYAEKEEVGRRIHFMQSDGFPEELRRRKYDVIVAKDIVEHIQDDEQFLRDLSACQDPGGRLILSTQNGRSLNAVIGRLYHRWIKRNSNWYGWDTTHLRFYTVAQIKQMLASNGYRVERVASVYLLPYGISNQGKSWALPIVHLSSTLDRLLGGFYPFNRLGWNCVVDATKC